MTDTVAIEQVEETLKNIEQLVLDKKADQALEQLEASKNDTLSQAQQIRYFYAYGEAYFQKELYNEALVKYKRSLDRAESERDVPSQGRALEQIGIILHRMQRLRDAYTYANRSLSAWQSIKNIEGQGRAHRNLGNIYVDAGDARRALDHFNKSQQFFREAGLPDEMAPAIIHKASVLYSQQNFAEAMKVYNEGIENDKCHHYLVLNNYGFLLMMNSEYEKALQMLEGAWKDIEAKKVEDDDLALVKLNIGMAYVLQDQMDKGETFLREAAELLEKFPDARAVELLLQVNDDYRGQGFQKCLVVDNAKKQAITHLNLAAIKAWTGRKEEALKEAEVGIELDKDMAYTHLAAGWIYLAAGDKEKASRAFQRAYGKEPNNEEFKKALSLINPYVMQKVGRNEPCPCGSGKKFKKCHGALA
ncbi:MAG: tetratricopeptide repeat protein [bacterium]|nr:tetratricopeptide repeat protein [bacterium]